MARGIISTVNANASLGGKEKNAISDMKSARSQIAMAMDTAKMESAFA